MNTITKTRVKKASFSVDLSNWKELESSKNKSAVVNEALSFYFDYKDRISSSEKKYWENVEKSILNWNWEYFSINPNWEKITDELLEEKLWS